MPLLELYQRIVFAAQAADASLLLFKLFGSQPDIRNLFVLLIGAGANRRGLNGDRAFALLGCVVFEALAKLPACSVEGIAPLQNDRFICFTAHRATRRIRRSGLFAG